MAKSRMVGGHGGVRMSGRVGKQCQSVQREVHAHDVDGPISKGCLVRFRS